MLPAQGAVECVLEELAQARARKHSICSLAHLTRLLLPYIVGTRRTVQGSAQFPRNSVMRYADWGTIAAQGWQPCRYSANSLRRRAVGTTAADGLAYRVSRGCRAFTGWWLRLAGPAGASTCLMPSCSTSSLP